MMSLALLSNLIVLAAGQIKMEHRKDAFIPLEEKLRRDQESHQQQKEHTARLKRSAEKQKFVKNVLKTEKVHGKVLEQKVKEKKKKVEKTLGELKQKKKKREVKKKHFEHDKKQHEKKEKKRRRLNAGRREL